MLISSNSISNEGLVVLKPTLTSLINLTALDLSLNRLDMRNSEAIDNLADSLHALVSLQRLGLSGMHLKNSLRTLLSNIQNPLHYLNVASCRLSPGDMEYLSTSVHVSSLREVDLGSNSISKCFEHFTAFLQNASSTLCSLDAEDCGFHLEQLMVILKTHLPTCVQLCFCNLSAQCDTFPEREILDALQWIILAPLLRALCLTLEYGQTLEHIEMLGETELNNFAQNLDSRIRELCSNHNRRYILLKIKVQSETDY